MTTSLHTKYNPYHDEHGRFTEGPDAGKLIEQARLGGFSENPFNRHDPQHGYMVSTVGNEESYDPKKFGSVDITRYVMAHSEELKAPNAYLGGWLSPEDGKFYLDVSQNVQDRDTAEVLGVARNQYGIYGVENKEYIPVKSVRQVTKRFRPADDGSHPPITWLDPTNPEASHAKMMALLRVEKGLTAMPDQIVDLRRLDGWDGIHARLGMRWTDDVVERHCKAAMALDPQVLFEGDIPGAPSFNAVIRLPLSGTVYAARIQKYSDTQARDNSGRWTSSGTGFAESKPGMMNEFGRMASPLERRMEGVADKPATPHFIEEHPVAGVDSGGWSTSNPAFLLPTERDGIALPRGQGVLRDDKGMELQTYDSVRNNIGDAMVAAKDYLATAQQHFAVLNKDVADFSYDKDAGVAHNQVGLNALDSAASTLTAFYRGAPADHPVGAALNDFERNDYKLHNAQSAMVDPGDSPSRGDFKEYRALYGRSLKDLTAAYEPMVALVNQVGAEQRASGQYATKHFRLGRFVWQEEREQQ